MLYALPTLTEEKISCYIRQNYQGSYNVNKSFGVEQFLSPLILVAAGRFKQVEVGTDLYNGELIIRVETQIDDVLPTDPIATHDNTVATIYGLLEDSGAVLAAVNGGPAFNLWSIWVSSYEQGRDERNLISIITYDINCQTLALANY